MVKIFFIFIMCYNTFNSFRRETLRVLGLIGALDPYKHKMNIGMIQATQDTGVALICMTDNKIEDTSGIVF